MIKKDGKEYYSLEEASNILDEKIKVRAKKVVNKINLRNQKKVILNKDVMYV